MGMKGKRARAGGMKMGMGKGMKGMAARRAARLAGAGMGGMMGMNMGMANASGMMGMMGMNNTAAQIQPQEEQADEEEEPARLSIVETAPQNQAAGVPRGASVRVVLSGSIDIEAQPSDIFSIKDVDLVQVAGNTTYDDETRTLIFTPAAPLAAGKTYLANVMGLVDAKGDPLVASRAWSFST